MIKIIRFIIGLFATAKKYLAYVDQAILIVNMLKAAFDSQVAISLTAVIPGDWDEVVRVKVAYALGKAAMVLGRVSECEGKTGEERIACYLKWLKVQPDEVRSMNYARIALLIAKELADALKLSEAELNAVIQTRYVQQKNSV